jgi:uncharacterized protein DUF4381/uncharacterized protein DUF58
VNEPGVHVALDDLVRLQYRARGFSFLPRQPVHSLLAGRRASRLRGRGLDFEEIRAYQPGDDIRTMDWHVTARTRKPHVRVYTEERDRPALLGVDQRRSMFFGSRRAMKSVVAAEAAALAAWRVLHAGDRVGALVFDDEEVTELAAHRSGAQVMRILETVTEKNRALRVDSQRRANPDMLDRVLDRAVRAAAHDWLVCLIGDLAGAGPATVELVTRPSAHNDVLMIFVHDPLEAALPDAGRLVMGEGDLQLEVDTSAGAGDGADGAILVVPVTPPTSLDRLHDLVVPPAVSWWPVAPGWYVVVALVLTLGLAFAWRAWVRWRAAAYRRAALAELADLEARAADDGQREAVLRQVPPLLKRTALAAFPREAVAPLSGSAWLGFLDRTGGTDAFTRGRGQVLGALAYDPRAARMDAAAAGELFRVVRTWIGTHDASAAI